MDTLHLPVPEEHPSIEETTTEELESIYLAQDVRQAVVQLIDETNCLLGEVEGDIYEGGFLTTADRDLLCSIFLASRKVLGAVAHSRAIFEAVRYTWKDPKQSLLRKLTGGNS